MARGNASRLFGRVPVAGVAAAAVGVIFLLAAPATYAAASLYVNAATGTDSGTCGASTSPCRTIQEAVNNASAGDTIEVAAGTYDDLTVRECTAPVDGSRWPCSASVIISKSLTLRGAQAGTPGSAARAAGSPATESVVTAGPFEIQAPGVTVDGFSFTDSNTQVCVACDPGPLGVADGATIENDVFSGYETSPIPYGIYQVGDAIGINDAPNTHITGNYFTSPTADVGAVVRWFAAGCSGADVSNNVFDGADRSATADIYFWCDNFQLHVQPPTGTLTVSGNRDTNMGNSDFAFFTHVDAGTAGEIDVTGNTVAMLPSGGASSIYVTSAPGLARLDISGNTVHGAPFRAVKLNTSAAIPGTVSITGNDFSHNGVGVYVATGALAPGAAVTLAGNDLAAESGDILGDPPVGVYDAAGSGGAVVATDNWWGCNGGPGAAGCSAVSGSASFAPWLVLGVSASPSSLYTSGNSTVTADVTHDSAGADASALGTLPNGTNIAFGTDFGTLSASSAGTSAGNASVMLTSSAPGTAHVTAALDSQTVSTPVTFAAPPRPTSIDQCKSGGWKSYGVFKNQGDCVSYVATHGKNPPGK